MIDKLRIAKIRNRCQFVGVAHEQAIIAGELEYLLNNRLALELSKTIDNQLNLPLENGIIVRIRKIPVKLSFSRDELTNGNAGFLFAHNIISGMEKILNKGTNEIVVFPSAIDFIAAFVCDLIDGDVWSKWQYKEFVALSHVSASSGLFQILKTQKENINSLLKNVRESGKSASLSLMLSQKQAKNLLEFWCDLSFMDLFKLPDLISKDIFFCSISNVEKLLQKKEFRNEFVELEMLYYFVNAIDEKDARENLIFLIAVAHFCIIRKNRKIFESLVLNDSREKLALNVEKISQVKNNELLLAFFLWSSQKEENFNYTKNIISKINDFPTESTITRGAELIEENVCLPAEMKIKSIENAGLSLLIPIVINLGLSKLISLRMVKESLNLAISGEQENKNILLDLLMPDNKSIFQGELDKLDCTALSERHFFGLNQSQKSLLSRLVDQELLAELLIAHFSSRLSGMNQSSIQYIRSNFLVRSGVVKESEDSIRVILNPLPLDILLRMSGFGQWSAQLPWLDKKLEIEIAR